MDGAYFGLGVTWADRLAHVLSTSPPFVRANAKAIEQWIDEHGVRVVIDVPADALLSMLYGNRYRNKYELEQIGGARRPSERRLKTDVLLGFIPDGRERFFGAVALGGAGIRFYGEYLALPRSRRQVAYVVNVR